MYKDFILPIIIFYLKTFFVLIIAVLFFVFAFGEYKDWENSKNAFTRFSDDGVCNIAVIPVSGTLGVTSTGASYDQNGQIISDILPGGDIDRIIYDLDEAKKLGYIDGVVLQIDSFGGMPIASEIFLNYMKTYNLPVVSYIREAGDSAAYAMAVGTNYIVSGETSSVGSIGSNGSFINNVEKNKKDGLKYISITTGKYKDLGTPDKDLSDEDLKYLKDENQKMGEIFKKWVMQYRNFTQEKVNQVADGRAWNGQDAKNLGLVDEVGDMSNVLAWFDEYFKRNKDGEKAIPCITNSF